MRKPNHHKTKLSHNCWSHQTGALEKGTQDKSHKVTSYLIPAKSKLTCFYFTGVSHYFKFFSTVVPSSMIHLGIYHSLHRQASKSLQQFVTKTHTHYFKLRKEKKVYTRNSRQIQLSTVCKINIISFTQMVTLKSSNYLIQLAHWFFENIHKLLTKNWKMHYNYYKNIHISVFKVLPLYPVGGIFSFFC